MNKENNLRSWPNVNLEDFDVFYLLFKLHEESLRDNRPANLKRMIESLRDANGKALQYSTTMGRLQRLRDFVYARVPSHMRESFFEEQARGAGIEPTPFAKELYHSVKVLLEIAEGVQAKAAASVDHVELLRIGSPQFVATRLLTAAMSMWPIMFPAHKYELETMRSVDLLPRLEAGLIDMVVTHGQSTAASDRIRFHSLNYRTHFILISHPAIPIRLIDNQSCLAERTRSYQEKSAFFRQAEQPGFPGLIDRNANDHYWEEFFRYRASVKHAQSPVSIYDRLRELDLTEIDFSHQDSPPLYYIRVWDIPEAVLALTKKLGSKACEASTYEDIYAQVSAGKGIAIVPEVFYNLPGITAFQLIPNADYERWLGVYYNRDRGLSIAALRILYYLQTYLKQFEPLVRRLRPPRLGDEVLESFCASNEFREDRDWIQIAREQLKFEGKITRDANVGSERLSLDQT